MALLHKNLFKIFCKPLQRLIFSLAMPSVYTCFLCLAVLFYCCVAHGAEQKEAGDFRIKGQAGVTYVGAENWSSGGSDGYLDLMLDISNTFYKDAKKKYSGSLKLHPYLGSSRLLPFDLISQASFAVEGDTIGRFEVGKTLGVAGIMKVDAFTSSGGTRDFLYSLSQFDYAHENCQSENCPFSSLYTPDLFSNSINYYSNESPVLHPRFKALGYGQRNNFKLNYITPSFGGIRLGVSYIPSLGGPNLPNFFASYSNVMQYAIFYATQFDDVAFKISVSYEHAGSQIDATGVRSHSLSGLEVGINIAYMGFTVGGSFGSLGKSGGLVNKFADLESSDYRSVGIGYRIGPFTTNLTYLGTKKALLNSITYLDRIALALDYKIMRDITSCVEISRLDFTRLNQSLIGSDGGYMIAIAAKLKF